MTPLEKSLGTIAIIVTESMRIFPDSLVMGTGIYALLTQSMAYGVFFMSLIETSLIYILIRTFANYVNVSGRFEPTLASHSEKCRSGFTMPSAGLDTLYTFGKSPSGIAFPSAPLFMLSSASAYIFTTLQKQKQELEALGPAYATRYYVSAFFLLMIICVFIAFRFSLGCESIPMLILSSVLGLITGTLLVIQNVRLFGAQSINLIGIPLLSNRTVSGSNLYVCPTK